MKSPESALLPEQPARARLSNAERKAARAQFVENLVRELDETNKKRDALDKELLATLRERDTAMKNIEEESKKDALTALLNRGAFEEQACETIQLLEGIARREEGTLRHAALLILDVDNFKSVNDTYGHPTGDGVLAMLGARLQQLLRGTDIIGRVGRVGGEEFAVALPGTSAETALERVFGHSFGFLFDEKINVTVSGGITEFKAEDAKEALKRGLSRAEAAREAYQKAYRRADNLLYRAKRGGKNQILLDPDLARDEDGEGLVA